MYEITLRKTTLGPLAVPISLVLARNVHKPKDKEDCEKYPANTLLDLSSNPSNRSTLEPIVEETMISFQ